MCISKPYSTLIFITLVLLHVSLVLLMRTDWATHAVWFTNVMSASLLLPLLVFDAIHLPVFEHREGFSWTSFTLLGWVLLCLFWATVYWGIALLACRQLADKQKQPQ
ncbi:MAG: hypothetical protein ACXW1P_03515 [Methylophilaceae bacterium]